MQKLIDAAVGYIRVLFAENTDGHDMEHSLRVYRNAMMIFSEERRGDPLVISLAALLHDTDDKKLFHTDDNENARSFLQTQGIDDITIQKICSVINGVSFSKNKGKRPETTEGEIVQDADRLDAIGAVGIARTFAYGGKHGRTPESSIQHFYEKLLLLRDLMNTETAKKMAESRHQFTETFLKEWEKENTAEIEILRQSNLW